MATIATRIDSAIAATLGADAKKADTGVGAPSYTSGVHMWNGTTAILNARPANTNTSPNVSPSAAVLPCGAPANDCAICSNSVEPAKPYTRLTPYSRIPLANEPSTKYLSPASADRRSRRIKLAST